MAIHPTDDRITSDVTPHVAYRHPSPVPGEHGWVVSWLPNRVVGYSLAISAMMIAELATVHAVDGTTTADDERRMRINDLAHELGMSGDEAIRLALAPIVHDAPAIPVHDDADRDLCAKEDCGECAPVEPAKTHDLEVHRRNGHVVISAENDTDVHQVYLPDGTAQDLGRALAPLTPAQRQLLVDDLTGGGK
jgi:hypothetical protein